MKFKKELEEYRQELIDKGFTDEAEIEHLLKARKRVLEEKERTEKIKGGKP